MVKGGMSFVYSVCKCAYAFLLSPAAYSIAAGVQERELKRGLFPREPQVSMDRCRLWNDRDSPFGCHIHVCPGICPAEPVHLSRRGGREFHRILHNRIHPSSSVLQAEPHLYLQLSREQVRSKDSDHRGIPIHALKAYRLCAEALYRGVCPLRGGLQKIGPSLLGSGGNHPVPNTSLYLQGRNQDCGVDRCPPDNLHAPCHSRNPIRS